jgi:hypothetical protein
MNERPSIKSPQYTAMRGARLTDARIDYYIRQGRYGTARQQALLQAERCKRKPKTKSIKQQLQDILPKLNGHPESS